MAARRGKNEARAACSFVLRLRSGPTLVPRFGPDPAHCSRSPEDTDPILITNRAIGMRWAAAELLLIVTRPRRLCS